MSINFSISHLFLGSYRNRQTCVWLLTPTSLQQHGLDSLFIWTMWMMISALHCGYAYYLCNAHRTPSTALGILWVLSIYPTPVLLPGKSQEQRSLVGCSPWRRWVGHDRATHFHFSLPCIGEGNGTPLQCSYLENPRDGEPGGLPSMGTRLKPLSSMY